MMEDAQHSASAHESSMDAATVTVHISRDADDVSGTVSGRRLAKGNDLSEDSCTSNCQVLALAGQAQLSTCYSTSSLYFTPKQAIRCRERRCQRGKPLSRSTLFTTEQSPVFSSLCSPTGPVIYCHISVSDRCTPTYIKNYLLSASTCRLYPLPLRQWSSMLRVKDCDACRCSFMERQLRASPPSVSVKMHSTPTSPQLPGAAHTDLAAICCLRRTRS